MNLVDVASACYVLALFVRDDGERLLLGNGQFPFSKDQMHFVANDVTSDVIELQGADGSLLAGQVQRAAAQSFDGLVGGAGLAAIPTEGARREFLSFFKTNQLYTVIYILPTGEAIQRREGYIVDAPSVEELYIQAPNYHVALNFQDVNYYEYSEDAEGNPTYAQSATIVNTEVTGGGVVWEATSEEV